VVLRAAAPGFVVTKPATPADRAAVGLGAPAASVMPIRRDHLVVGTRRRRGLGAPSRPATTGRSVAATRVALADRQDPATIVGRAVSLMIVRRAGPGTTARCVAPRTSARPAGVRSAATTVARLVDP
jgi:hypothetical protein